MKNDRYEELVQSVMDEFECDRSEAVMFIESTGMYQE